MGVKSFQAMVEAVVKKLSWGQSQSEAIRWRRRNKEKKNQRTLIIGKIRTTDGSPKMTFRRDQKKSEAVYIADGALANIGTKLTGN